MTDFHAGEEELRAILSGAAIAISLVAPDGRILWTNRPIGTVIDAPVGRSVFSFSPPSIHSSVREMIEGIMVTGQQRSYEAPVIATSGETVWQEIHTGAYRPRGETEGMVVVSVNIDARRRAEQARAESEEKLRSLVESLPGIIITMDKEYRMTSINRVPPGRTLDQIIGANALDFVPPPYRETAQQAFEQVLRTGELTSYETATINPREAIAEWLLVHVGPIRKGDEIVGLTIATEDITRRKGLEQELRQSLERAQGYARELEQKNEQLAEENAERRRTEEDLRRQREVVTRLSTPIIKAWEGVLVLPIIGALDGERAAHMMERLLAEIAATRARFAVLDLTGVDTVDTATVGYIVNIVRAASLLGSQCLVSGISPVVAQTMISLGTATQGFRTFAAMQDALKFAVGETGARGAP